jgi:hypothetical protein
MGKHPNTIRKFISSWSRWPRGLRRRCAATRLLGLRVRIPPEAWTPVSWECCVLSGSLCNGPILRREESYRVCVSLSVITCNSNPLHLQWASRKPSKLRNKQISFSMNQKQAILNMISQWAIKFNMIAKRSTRVNAAISQYTTAKPMTQVSMWSMFTHPVLHVSRPKSF